MRIQGGAISKKRLTIRGNHYKLYVQLTMKSIKGAYRGETDEF